MKLKTKLTLCPRALQEQNNKLAKLPRNHLQMFIHLQLIFFKAKDTKKRLSFSNSQCPRQTINVDCGYYVMKFMKDIITHRQLMIPMKYFEDCQFNSYDGEQLHEVKDEWATYVFNNFFSS
ncbi:uncharacterized protein LOC130729428 [Lotus japonicus]|uniref:uncharacterized protein LOC130729428 n=1 Tax=Lotus japonicus TaxID=34305 RepID=UPI00258CDB61|nr:uncharacterized protein LOC130729428 [Lotus japonicus]XP_057437171.1 uncharacterized protein LOC130729428 [Lotus japonicus]XP_057437172.1 uncharacterized protein LOC130729428 [Lotus japonicus]